jgi:hypothetical protein
MGKTRQYECWFQFGGEEKPRSVKADRMDRFTEGFWIDPDLNFTLASDCKYWIPPGQIILIELKEG